MSIPPDTAGAVGPQHVFNPLNDNVTVFDRSGTQLLSLSLDDFWRGEGFIRKTFDPRVVFDPHEDRFVFVTMANAEMPTSSILIAVSETDDPTGSWIPAEIRVDDQTQGAVWLDFPSVGFSGDKVTVQVNLYTRSGNDFAGSTIYVFDKASMYDPQQAAVYQSFVLTNQGGTHVPAVTYDAGIDDQYLLSRWSGDVRGEGYLALYQVTGRVTATGRATLARLGLVAAGGQTWEAFAPGDLAPQAGTAKKIDVGDDRLLGVCYRDDGLYASHTVLLPLGNPTRSAVQWWEIDAIARTRKALERLDDPAGTEFFAFPTIAVNSRGDLLVGHARFSAGIHASADYLLRRAGSAVRAGGTFANGLATYHKTFGGTVNRWGDYSATQVDPVNDVDFWTVQEYAETPQDTWGTMWAQIKP